MTPDKQPSENSTLRQINASLGGPSRNPVTFALLYASGVPRKLLHLVPVERTEFLVQGTGVFLAAGLAFVSTFLASALIVDPAPSTGTRVLLGVIVSAVIFTVDRCLVRTILKPYEFPPDVLHTLWDPTADAKWYDVLQGSLHEESLADRITGFIAVMVKAGLRFLLAGFIAYLIADVLVIDAFKTTVDARATRILTDERDQAIAADKQALRDGNDRVAAATKALAQLEAADPSVTQFSSTLSAQKQTVLDLTHDIDVLTVWIRAETVGGTPYLPAKLSDGTQLERTTGKPNCGPVCQADKPLLISKQQMLGIAQAAVSSAEQNQASAISNISGDPKYKSQSASITADATDILKSYKKNFPVDSALSIKPSGILIRRQALGELTGDVHPELLKPTPPKPCAGPLRILCVIQRAVFPTTPLGLYVGVFRAILFLVDTLPITLKIFYSLRKRRPYEALVAALEESSVADAVNRLDHSLNELGATMEDRAAHRRGRRRGSGARLLRETRGVATRRRLSQRVTRTRDSETHVLERKRFGARWHRARQWWTKRTLPWEVVEPEAPPREPKNVRTFSSSPADYYGTPAERPEPVDENGLPKQVDETGATKRTINLGEPESRTPDIGTG